MFYQVASGENKSNDVTSCFRMNQIAIKCSVTEQCWSNCDCQTTYKNCFIWINCFRSLYYQHPVNHYNFILFYYGNRTYPNNKTNKIYTNNKQCKLTCKIRQTKINNHENARWSNFIRGLTGTAGSNAPNGPKSNSRSSVSDGGSFAGHNVNLQPTISHWISCTKYTKYSKLTIQKYSIVCMLQKKLFSWSTWK